MSENKNYYVNAIISINDNEKNIDYRTENSPLFNMNNLQAPTISAKNIYVSASTVTGEFTIYDPDNTIDKTKNISIISIIMAFILVLTKFLCFPPYICVDAIIIEWVALAAM